MFVFFPPLQHISRSQNNKRLCQAQKMDEVKNTYDFCRSLSTFKYIIKWFVCLVHRKCKITLGGPWQQVPPIPLSDVSLMPCLAQSRMEHVPVWALSDKGDVLCRLGVSPQEPAVRNLFILLFLKFKRRGKGDLFTLFTMRWKLVGTGPSGPIVSLCV